MIAGGTARVLKPAILDNPVIDAETGVNIRRVGLNELRTRVEQPDAIHERGLGAGIENDFIIPGVPDRQVGDSGVGAVGPDPEGNVDVIGIVYSLPASVTFVLPAEPRIVTLLRPLT